jgi:hypothetical protein
MFHAVIQSGSTERTSFPVVNDWDGGVKLGDRLFFCRNHLFKLRSTMLVHVG